MLLVILLSSIIGIIIGLYLRFNLYIALYFLLIFMCICFRKNSAKIIMLISCSLIFSIYINFQINNYDTKYKNGLIESNFKIISYKEEKDYYDKYIAKNDKGDKFILYLPRTEEIKKGTIIYLQGEFILPDEARNTGGFNYRRYLNSQNIYGNIFTKKYEIIELSKFNIIYFIQDEVQNSLRKLFPKNEMGLILGMMIGETKDISEEILNNFKKTGITHLLAVSGSNVVYVLLMVQFIFKKVIGKRGSYFVSIIFLIIFMLISGASSSVVRATIMMILNIVANILYLKSDTISNISFSALILLIINPLIIYDVGFILSFGGTIGIVLLSKDFNRIFKKLGKISETLSVTISAQLVLTPVMMYYFNTFSILSVITNILVVPISGTITILGFFVFLISKIFFPLAIFLSKSLYILVKFTILVSDIFSKIPFSNIQVITPNLFEILFFYFIIFYSMRKIPTKKKYKFIGKNNKPSLKLITMSIIIFISSEIIFYSIPQNFVDVRVIDVGQGDSILIKTTRGKNILIDGGGSETSNYDVGKNILLPYLLDMRVTKVDLIISSHSDADHLSGLITVLENLKVKKFVIAKNAIGYEKLYELARYKKFEIAEVQKGESIYIDDLKFEVLSPNANMDNLDVNEYSLVVKLLYGNESMLFTGDMGEKGEKSITNAKSDILKVGHHGSNSSSSQKFIDKVSPSFSVISVGKNNSYGHPSKEVINRLEKISKVYTTSIHGEIKIKIFKDFVKIE